MGGNARPAQEEWDGPTPATPDGSGEPGDWAEPAPDRPVPFWESVALDLIAHFPPDRRGGPPAVRFLRRLGVVVRSSGFHVTFWHRAAHQLYHRLGLPGRAAAGLIFWFL